MGVPRDNFTATVLSNGKVLAAGGFSPVGIIYSSAELFTPPPSVTSVSPSVGATSGGTAVTITGTGFRGATGVSFNGTPGTNVVVVSPTQITAESPAGTGSGDLIVTTPGGTSQPTTANLVAGAVTPSTGNVASPSGYVPPDVSDVFSYGMASLSASSNSLGFGSEAIGAPSVAQTVTLTNSSGIPVKIGPASFGGTNAVEFSTTANTCTATTLAPGASCAITIVFTPSVVGPASADLSIASDAPHSPFSIVLAGTGTGNATSSSTGTTTNNTTTNNTTTNNTTTNNTTNNYGTGSGSGTGNGNTTPGSPGASTSIRLSGANRIATAIAASQQAFPKAGSAHGLVLARSDEYPDALVGAPLAAAKGGPLLLTESSHLDPATKAEIQRVLPTSDTVYLLGGNTALSPSLVSALQALHYKVTRISGDSRFATAVAVAKELGNPTQIFEVTGTDFPDAVSAGPAAVALHGAILLTNGSKLASETTAYLAARPKDHRSAIGGPATVADRGATPVAGPDRFATSAAVAATFFPAPKAVGLATGLDFPDALSGGPLVGSADGPMLLVHPNTPLPGPVKAYLSGPAKASVGTIYTFGGSSAVSDGVAGAAHTALG
ncbi:MAG: cell wall-binding repeat-containing protein [Acidimicrobiales bacterium]